jgi:endonuclease/exonuclease/phosphatase family metal-dependent hydrolase
VKLVTYNIQYGKGRDGRFDLPRIAAELEGADVIALQEVERFWPRSGNVDQAAELADLLGDYFWVYGAGVDLYPGPGAGAGQRLQFGNMLLSRAPILMSRNHLLPKYASLGPVSIQRSALEGLIECRTGLLRVYSLHLTHLTAETRMPQIERLLSIHESAGREGPAMTGDLEEMPPDQPVPERLPREAILMGDFNFEPSSMEYKAIVGPMSVYGGRVINPEGFVDAWVAAGNHETDGVSAHIHGRAVRLDYCFVSAAHRDRIRDVRIDEDAVGSDHQPVWLEMDL